MPRYKVTVQRTAIQTCEILVEASNATDATDKAVEEAIRNEDEQTWETVEEYDYIDKSCIRS